METQKWTATQAMLGKDSQYWDARLDDDEGDWEENEEMLEHTKEQLQGSQDALAWLEGMAEELRGYLDDEGTSTT